MKRDIKAAVVGAGVAGMATAIRLAVQGLDVTLFETNSVPGGKMAAFQMDGFHFDAGPSLFVQPHVLEQLFRSAGVQLEDYLRYTPVSRACQYFYEDGTVIEACSQPEAFAREITSKTGEPAVNVLRYLRQSENTFTSVAEPFLDQPFGIRQVSRWGVRALKGLRPSFVFNSLAEVNSNAFRDGRVVQLFNRYATYSGSDPFRAPGMFCLVPHPEFNEGVYFPEGGMAGITNALFTLAKDVGVKFHFDTPVRRIIHHSGRVKGVVVEDSNIDFDLVVSNVDVYNTYQHLIRDCRRSSREAKRERSSSAVVFYWGIDREFPGMQLHNIFFSNNYPAEFRSIFKESRIYDDPTVYVNITAKCFPGLAPPGKENWFVMVNAPSDSGQNWVDLTARCREHVIAKLSRLLQTDIESVIVCEKVLDPPSLAAGTGAWKGAIYGSSANSRRQAFFRPGNRDREIRGLYFAGGTVHPGGGIPLCLRSAAIVSDLIARDYKEFNH